MSDKTIYQPTYAPAARELALQVLFLWDANDAQDFIQAEVVAVQQCSDADARGPGLEMAAGAWDDRSIIDGLVDFHAPQWPVRRQPPVDRNVIRLAAWEMRHRDTPPKLVIDNAIELAKKYSTEQSGAFVNGVLDAIYRDIAAMTGGVK